MGQIGLRCGVPPEADLPGFGLPKAQVVIVALWFFTQLDPDLQVRVAEKFEREHAPD